MNIIKLKPVLESDVFVSTLRPFCVPGPLQPSSPHLVVLSLACLGCDSRQTSFVFDDFDSFQRTGQIFCRLSLSWYVSDVLLTTSLRLHVLERRITGKAPFLLRQVSGRDHEDDLAPLPLTTCLSPGLSVFSTVWLPPSFPAVPLWKEFM